MFALALASTCVVTGMMKARKTMPASFWATLCLVLCLAAAPALGQSGQPATNASEADALGSSLTELLALATGGTVATREQAGLVTRNGDNYLVRLPLSGFSKPPDAAVNAVARPLEGGVWDITSVTFPSSGAVQSMTPNSEVAYSIGEQTIRIQIDPSFVQPSSYSADLGAVSLRSDRFNRHTEQSVDRYVTDGTLSAGTSGDLNFSSRGSATNWRLTARAPDGFETAGEVRTVSGQLSFEGMDRAQGTRLLAAIHALMAGMQPATPSQPPGVSAAQRQGMRAVIDAASGLLSSFQSQQTLDDIRFSVGPAGSGTIGRVRADLTGGAVAERLDARMDLAVDGFVLAGLAPDTAVYVPHHIDMKSALKGVRVGPLMALLRAATEQGADPAALLTQATALLGDTESRVGIESLTFDSGPLRVTGSMRMVPLADGQPGADIHLSATGMDTLISQAEATPALQRALPVMFMARGMGRPDGGGIAWDIAVGDGSMTVNGVAFGQGAGRKR